MPLERNLVLSFGSPLRKTLSLAVIIFEGRLLVRASLMPPFAARFFRVTPRAFVESAVPVMSLHKSLRPQEIVGRLSVKLGLMLRKAKEATHLLFEANYLSGLQQRGT